MMNKTWDGPSHLSCLFSCAALSRSWIFLVICSVFRMTSSVLGRLGSDSHSWSSSSGMELLSPIQPLLRRRHLRTNLLWQDISGWVILLRLLDASLMTSLVHLLYIHLAKREQLTQIKYLQSAKKGLSCRQFDLMVAGFDKGVISRTPSHPSRIRWPCCHSHRRKRYYACQTWRPIKRWKDAAT